MKRMKLLKLDIKHLALRLNVELLETVLRTELEKCLLQRQIALKEIEKLQSLIDETESVQSQLKSLNEKVASVIYRSDSPNNIQKSDSPAATRTKPMNYEESGLKFSVITSSSLPQPRNGETILVAKRSRPSVSTEKEKEVDYKTLDNADLIISASSTPTPPITNEGVEKQKEIVYSQEQLEELRNVVRSRPSNKRLMDKVRTLSKKFQIGEDFIFSTLKELKEEKKNKASQ